MEEIRAIVTRLNNNFNTEKNRIDQVKQIIGFKNREENNLAPNQDSKVDCVWSEDKWSTM